MTDNVSQTASTEDGDAEVQLRSALLSDVGLVRDHNEDSALIGDGMRFFVVADGMGGHAAGEIASAMAVDGIKRHLETNEESLASYSETPSEAGALKIAEVLEGAVREAHRSVYERGIAEPDKQGMGTTLDVLLVVGQDAFIAHVGDSRTYLMRGSGAAQITADHTQAEVLVVQGQLTPEEALVSPLRNILVNALGVAAEVGVEMAHLRLIEGDRLLLCSDGLHDYFPDEQELHDEVTTKEPEQALSVLIEAAKIRGGHDNITAVLVEVTKAPPVEISESLDEHQEDETEAAQAVPISISQEQTIPVATGAATSSNSGANAHHKRDLRKTMPLQVRPIISAISQQRAGTEDQRKGRGFSVEPTLDRESESDDSGEE